MKMIQKIFLAVLATFAILPMAAQNTGKNENNATAETKVHFNDSADDKYIESGIIPMQDKSGINFTTKAGEFLFKPYLLMQTTANFNYYDDEGLALAEQDNVANSGFAIPNAIMGFSGKAFGKLTFNIAINAASSGASLLQQAWFDVNFNDALRLRAGKFKTPFQHAYLTSLGQTLFPSVPSSVTTAVRTNISLDAVQPSLYTGFDLGVQLHGVIKNRFGYQVGIFNGSGIGSNSATKGTSDDYKGLPSMLYAARLSYMPFGEMPTHQGDPNNLHDNKMGIALAGNYHVEGNSESSNDTRAGVEFSWIHKRLYIGAEGYLLHMKWTQRMQRTGSFTSWGSYAQAGYFVSPKMQVAARYDFFDRNGTQLKGLLNMPAVGLNYFFVNYNLKLQAMYQYIGKYGHETQLERDNDDMGMAYHSAKIMLQYTF